MENQFTIEKVGEDEGDWEKVRNAMADVVLLDYSSMTGCPADLTAAPKSTVLWAELLPGFGSTHHKLANFRVTKNGHDATTC